MENEEVRNEQTQENQAPTLEDLQAQIASLTAERDKLKQTVSASNSDASKRKKEAQDWETKYKEKLSEQERKELEAKQMQEQLTTELAQYKEKERISSYKAKLMSAGYDDATASTMATALPEGVTDDFFDSQKAFLEQTKQNIKTQAINSQPGLSVGMPPSTTESKEDDQLKRWFGL